MNSQIYDAAAAGTPGREAPLQWQDLFVFFIPATLFIELELIGRIFLTDLLLMVMLPVLLFSGGGVLRRRLPRTFLLLGGLWLASQVVSDLVVTTPFDDLARGWAKILMTGSHFIALYLLLDGRPRRVILFAAGLALGWLLNYLTTQDPVILSAPWKFGYGASVTWGLVLLATAVGNRRLLAVLLLMAAGGINFLLGFRSLGGVCMIGGLYVALTYLWRSQAPVSLWKSVAALLMIAIFGTAIYEGYQAAAEAGLLGEEARHLQLWQSQGELGLLFGGRSESLVALQAIKDSPLLGYGSWAKDCGYAEMVVPILSEFGYLVHYDPYSSCLIPTHSHLIGAWTEAGILGALFWAWVLGFIVVVAQHNLSAPYRLTPLVAFIAFLLAWDVLFSPFGADRRFVVPFLVCVLMFSLDWARSARGEVAGYGEARQPMA